MNRFFFPFSFPFNMTFLDYIILLFGHYTRQKRCKGHVLTFQQGQVVNSKVCSHLKDTFFNEQCYCKGDLPGCLKQYLVQSKRVGAASGNCLVSHYECFLSDLKSPHDHYRMLMANSAQNLLQLTKLAKSVTFQQV